MSPSDSLRHENIGVSNPRQAAQHTQHSLAHQPTPDAHPANAVTAGQLPTGLEERVRSPHNEPPMHPAHFAPFAEEAPVQSPVSSVYQPPPSPYRSPPHSPGPLPVKINLAEQSAPAIQTATIAPDENPLKSPRSPPSAKASFAPTWPTNNESARNSFPNHLPGQTMHQDEVVKGGYWSTGLCSLSDIGTCCLGITCPCVLYGRTQYRLSRKSKREDQTNMLGFELCNASCAMMACLCGLQCMLPASFVQFI